MQKLTTKQLDRINKTVSRLTKLFGEIDNFSAKNSFPKTSALAERKTKFLLARKKKTAKIKG